MSENQTVTMNFKVLVNESQKCGLVSLKQYVGLNTTEVLL